MKIFLVYTSTPGSNVNDDEIIAYINSSKFDWWRYNNYDWILVTPDNISTNQILEKFRQFYENTVIGVFDIDINNYSGYGPLIEYADGSKSSIFDFFRALKSDNYIPGWERNNYQNIISKREEK